MPGGDKNMEKLLMDLLDVKNRYGLDNDKFLVLIGLINLMSIINLLEGRVAGGDGKQAASHRRTPPEKIPFMGMFGGPARVRQPVEEENK